MGMQFNPMYQPTSTKTITVDGDLNLNPYDVLAVDGKFDTVEADEFVGNVTGNVVGNVTGNIVGLHFIPGVVGTSGDETYATLAGVSITGLDNESHGQNSPYSFTFNNNYSISYPTLKTHSFGVYTRRSDLSGTTSPSLSSRTVTVTIENGGNTPATATLYYKLSSSSTWSSVTTSSTIPAFGGTGTVSFSASPGTYQIYTAQSSYRLIQSISIPAGTTYYVKYATP